MAGAKLGPSATPEHKAEVNELRKSAFGGAGAQHSELVTGLRHKIGKHLELVEVGRARSDMLDLDTIVTFNRKLMNRQVSHLSVLSSRVSWFVRMMQELQEETRIMFLLARAIESGADLLKESRFWSNAQTQKK